MYVNRDEVRTWMSDPPPNHQLLGQVNSGPWITKKKSCDPLTLGKWCSTINTKKALHVVSPFRTTNYSPEISPHPSSSSRLLRHGKQMFLGGPVRTLLRRNHTRHANAVGVGSRFIALRTYMGTGREGEARLMVSSFRRVIPTGRIREGEREKACLGALPLSQSYVLARQC